MSSAHRGRTAWRVARMKLWRQLLLLIIIATLAALAWHWLALDPGYVLVRLRGWRAETTVIAAVALLLLLWLG